jgi:hypothetical protein
MAAKKELKRDPMKSKTGKPHMGPLNVEQLTKLLADCRPKHKNKIQRALNNRTLTQQVSKKIVAEEIAS